MWKSVKLCPTHFEVAISQDQRKTIQKLIRNAVTIRSGLNQRTDAPQPPLSHSLLQRNPAHSEHALGHARSYQNPWHS